MRINVALLLVALGCANLREARAWHITPNAPPARPPPQAVEPSGSPSPALAEDPIASLTDAAARATPGARRVLETTREMLESGAVVRGNCGTWVREVYRRAGGRTHTVFTPSRRERFAEASRLQPGDWVSFINHSYNHGTHAAIFVGWVDEGARVARMVSYPGENRDAPGRFSEYALTNVYSLVRIDERATPTISRLRARSGARR